MKGYVHSEWQSFHAYFFPSFPILTITVVLYNCTQHREELVFQRILSSFHTPCKSCQSRCVVSTLHAMLLHAQDVSESL